MKKTLVALAVLAGGLFTVSQSNAQMVPGSNLSIGVSPMLPVGKLADATSFGIGGDLQYGYNFDESIGLTLSAGYNHFFAKSQGKIFGQDIKTKDVAQVPIKAGVKYGIGSFYLHPQLGVAIPVGDFPVNGVKLKPGFLYGAAVGTNVAGFDLSLRYEASDSKFDGGTFGTSDDKMNVGFVGLRVGYTLPLGR